MDVVDNEKEERVEKGRIYRMSAKMMDGMEEKGDMKPPPQPRKTGEEPTKLQ